MWKSTEIVICILFAVAFLVVFPLHITREKAKLSERNYIDKELYEFGYDCVSDRIVSQDEIYAYPDVSVGAFYYSGNTLMSTTWNEIEEEVEENGSYKFFESYVIVRKAGKEKAFVLR